MGDACRWATLLVARHVEGALFQVYRPFSSSSAIRRKQRRMRSVLLWAVHLLCLCGSVSQQACAFHLPPAGPPCYALHHAVGSGPLFPHLRYSTPAHKTSMGFESDTPDPEIAADAKTEAHSKVEGVQAFPLLDRAGITAPMRHMPRGTRLIPGFPGPQFVTLGPSIRYRRRLRRHRRDEGWQFSNLPHKRNFFAARRNHRDQMMHSWMLAQHKQCKRRARDIISNLQNHSRRIFEHSEEAHQTLDKRDSELSQNPEKPLHEKAAVDYGADQDTQDQVPTPSVTCAERVSVAGDDCVSAVRVALQACPSPEVLRTMSSKALGSLHALLLDLLVDTVIAVASPEAIAAAATQGFKLPPASAAVAASPLPWWNSGGGLQPWRGRKVAKAQQSRRVNWANPRRSVEPTVAGVLLPTKAAAVVAAERNARSTEVLDFLRELMGGPSNTKHKNGSAQKQAPSENASTAMAALPWFVEAEDQRLQNLLKWTGASTKKLDRVFGKPTLPENTGIQDTEENILVPHRRNGVGDFSALRRALGAAIDVSLHLTEAFITKKSGAAAPYSWESPFLKSASSSKRRRWRERRPPPGERLPSRQARLIANRNKRIAAQNGVGPGVSSGTGEE